MNFCVIRDTDGAPSPRHAVLRSYLATSGGRVDEVTLNVNATAEAEGDPIQDAFRHTPQALVDSWDFARRAALVIEGYDVVVVDDCGGSGGVLALETANRRSSAARQLWTVAGKSSMLRMLQLSQSLATSDGPTESVIDWEMVQYRFSDMVLCFSTMERDLLASVGIDAAVVPVYRGRTVEVEGPSEVVYAPGPVSRANSSPGIFRAASGTTDVSFVFDVLDEADDYWSGTTWQAFDGVRGLAGDAVRRSKTWPPNTDLVVVGDPFDEHDETMGRAARTGVPVAAPLGSVVAGQWEGVALWESEDDLVSIISGEPPLTSRRPEENSVLVEPISADPGRARDITVGIPIFGQSPFLGELIASVGRQTSRPERVTLISDGSPAIEASQIAAWEAVLKCPISVTYQANRGVCVARNRLLDELEGDAILLVDQDDLLTDTALEKMAEALRSNPGRAAIACWTEFFGDYKGIEAKPPFDRRVGHRENPIVSTAVLIDRSAVDDGARFEPDLAFLYCEDWNYWAEMTSRGHLFGLVPEPLVRHRVHSSSGGFQRTEAALAVGRQRARDKLG
jgi:GT2 family glycosyltransferase